MPTIVNIGSNSTVVGGTVTITVGAGGVPAGAQIFVSASDNGSSGSGAVSDTAGNSYATTEVRNTVYVSLSRARLGTGGGLALNNGDIITYFLSTLGTIAAVNAFYVVGLVNTAVDVVNTATGSSTTPSVSGTPNFPNEFFIGLVGGASLVTSFTQDSTNAAWASPPGQVSIAAPVLGGGNVVKAAASSLTYAPTFGTSDVWAAIISGYLINELIITSQAAKYNNTKYTRFLYNSWTEPPSVIETNQHFVGKFKPVSYFVNKGLYQNDIGFDVEPEAKGSIQVVVYDTPRPSLSVTFNNLYERKNSFDVVTDIANPHFVGKFKPVSYFVNKQLYQQDTSYDVVSETNVHYLSKFVAAKYNVNRSLFQLGEVENGAVPETNNHTIGQYKPVKLTINNALFGNAPTNDVVVETNTNWLASYKPANLFINRSLFGIENNDTQLFETPNHFIGKYTSVFYKSFRYNHNVDVAVAVAQPETNPHYLGKFTQVKYSRFAYNTEECELPPQISSEPSIVVVTYDNPRPVLSAALVNYYWKGALDPAAQAAQPETNPHFLGRFVQAKYRLFSYNSCDTGVAQSESNTHFVPSFVSPIYSRFKWNTFDVSGLSGTPQVETNTNFLAQFKPINLVVNRKLYQSERDDSSTVLEQNPHFIAKFIPAKYARFPYNYISCDFPAVAEAQPHFLARFAPVKYSRFLFNGTDITGFVPQPETNINFLAQFKPERRFNKFSYNFSGSDYPAQVEMQPHFLANFKPVNIIVNKGLYQENTSYDIQVETNTFTIARYRAATITINRTLYEGLAIDQTIETNISFVGRFKQAALVTPIALRTNIAADTSYIPETNTNQIGRFYRPQIRLLQGLWNNQANDIVVIQEQNPHFLSRYTATRYNRFNYNHEGGEFPPVVETQPHFVGKFKPVKYNRFGFNDGYDNSGITTTQAETNTNFIARYQPAQLIVHRYNVQDHDLSNVAPFVFTSKTKVSAIMTSYTSIT